MKTLAAVLVQLNRPLELLELDIPPLKRGQVLVKMAYSGLCHTQLNECRGRKGPDPYLPHTIGHEGSGTILDVGEGVTKVKIGDHVVVSWIKGAGIDVPSATYQRAGEPVNSGAVSTFLDKAIVSENRLVPISKEVCLKLAALFGCAIPTGAGVIFNEMRLKKGQSLAVFGCGGIGSSAIVAAKQAGAFPIIAVDVQPKKLQFALSLGATHTIDASQTDPLSKIREILEGKYADFALEAAGISQVMQTAFSSVKDNGGHCILAGNLAKQERITIDPFDLIRGKKLTGTWGGSSNPDRDIPLFLDKLAHNNSPIRELIDREVPLHQINQLMDELERGYEGRGLVVF